VEPAHAVPVGVACATHRLPLEPCVVAFLHGFAANLISAGVRLIPLGQTDGQRLTAALEGHDPGGHRRSPGRLSSTTSARPAR
jgi:urease accessory protein UreF